MNYQNIREEELKNKVEKDFFGKFDCTEIIKDIDFAVRLPTHALPNEGNYLLWAEAKQKPSDIVVMFTQLVLTIGKSRIFDKKLPPPFLGCFDSEKIAFLPYADIQDIFYQNDFNWKVAPSDHETKEFKKVYEQITKIINESIPWEMVVFDFEKDRKELKHFIRKNFADRAASSQAVKIRIDKNNFITIFNKWLETVQPTIAVKWDKAKARGILGGDFYLADLLSADNKTLKEKLFVLLHGNYYEFDRIIDEDDIYSSKRAEFADNQKAHTRFWAKYERPPLQEYWDYIIEQRDLLAPQDVRERKGSFFTPRIWVELSQKYIAETLGEDWQEEYVVWDNAAGTGNLLAGLTNKYNIWASTLDKADVDVMKERIRNGANLLESHLFQFDFLNDDFSKLPKGLQDIVNDPNRRKRLIIYINPPYAEAASKENVLGTGKNKTDVAVTTKVYNQYVSEIGIAGRELFVQFLARINREISGAMLAHFSKLKIVQGPNFMKFRHFFKAEFQKGFAVPANTFDNVKGDFPIAFMIWQLTDKKKFSDIRLDLYEKNSHFTGQKTFFVYDEHSFITDWFRKYHTRMESPNNIGSIGLYGSDFQHNDYIRITSPEEHPNRWTFITVYNLIETSIYYAVRKVIPATWLNDRDQFLYPDNGWALDEEFQNDCLAYTLFNNNVQSKYGANHWIPFSENEVNAREKFDSHFMLSFINGKLIKNGYSDLFAQEDDLFKKREFSDEAKAVFNAGRHVWSYYHTQQNCNVNASLYDIREHFQRRNLKEKMNSKSDNQTYNALIGDLRVSLKSLAKKLEPKVYTYGFLR